jgi:hypothetical protein
VILVSHGFFPSPRNPDYLSILALLTSINLQRKPTRGSDLRRPSITTMLRNCYSFFLTSKFMVSITLQPTDRCSCFPARLTEYMTLLHIPTHAFSLCGFHPAKSRNDIDDTQCITYLKKYILRLKCACAVFQMNISCKESSCTQSTICTYGVMACSVLRIS